MAAYSVTVHRKWCKSCGICALFCPKKVLVISDLKLLEIQNQEDCIGCHMCEWRCPDMAITVKQEGEHG